MTSNEEKLNLQKGALDLANQVVFRLQKELKEIWFECIKEKYGISIGTVVIVKGLKYRISYIEIPFGYKLDKPWVKGNPFTKKGVYGTAERNLYNEWSLEP